MAEKGDARPIDVKPAEKQVYSLARQSLKAGDAIAPEKLLVEKGHEWVDVTVTVDDPTADPPTDAKVMVIIEASKDSVTWYPVSHTWCGTSGSMRVSVPLNGHQVRVVTKAEMDNVVDISLKAR